MSDTKAIKTSRRTFLLAAGAGGAATVAAIATKLAPQRVSEVRDPQDKDKDKKSGQGYQETAHIRNYYRTTEV